MTEFIEDHRAVFGVGPICKVLPIAPSTYYGRVAVECDPDRASDRAQKDVGDRKDVERIYDASSKRYGARKIWHALRREGKDVARCTVERLMKAMEIQGPSRQNCYAIRLPGNGCTGWKGYHDQSRHGSAMPRRQGKPGVCCTDTEPALGI